MDVVDNYKKIEENIRKLSLKYRKGCDIKFVVVSKSQSVENMALLCKHGVRLFGESRVQEALPKIELLKKDFADVDFHFIGNLQANKIKKIVENFSLIQSVDSLDMLDTIDKKAQSLEKKQNVLLELNLAGEAQKGGIYEEDVEEVLEKAINFRNIIIKGFMAMQPYEASLQKTPVYFRKARNIFEKYSGKISSVDTLSMGMSNDYEVAVAEGATMVRVGSIVFE